MGKSLSLLIAASLAVSASAQSLIDSDLRVEKVVDGLKHASGMCVVGKNDFLIAQRGRGVRLYHEGAFEKTVLRSSFAGPAIAASRTFKDDRRLYVSYRPDFDSTDSYQHYSRILSWNWSSAKRKLVTAASAGIQTFGPLTDLAIGNTINQSFAADESGNVYRLENNVIRMSSSHAAAGTITFGPQPTEPRSESRNGPGAIAVDPITQNVWSAENGFNSRYDEVNLLNQYHPYADSFSGPLSRNTMPPNLSSYYSDPEFSWKTSVNPTSMTFVAGNSLGKKFKNALFVATARGGKLMRFDLNKDRTGLQLSGELKDLVDDNSIKAPYRESLDHVFGYDFGQVSDLVDGPDGLYVLSESMGTVYRISRNSPVASLGATVPEPSSLACVLASLAIVRRRRRT